MAARKAYRAGDDTRLEQIAERFKNTPLEPYLTYYQLRLRLYNRKPEGVKEFLARPDDTPVIDQLRSDWLKWQAKQRRWDEFAAEYPRLLEADDEMKCYALQARLPNSVDLVLHEARSFWFSGDGQPESCVTLFNMALATGVISEQDVWQRTRLALEMNNSSLVKQLSVNLPKERRIQSRQLESAAAHPDRYLAGVKLGKSTEAERMVALFALQRLAKQLPQLAYTRWKKIEDHFDEDEQHYFYGWLGYEAARRLDERALDWYKAAKDAPLNDLQLAWRARAALRSNNWGEVWASITAMSPKQQREGAWRYWKARAWKVSGRDAEAEASLSELSREYHFYGQLAADELGSVSTVGMMSVSYQPTLIEIEAMLAQPAMQRTLELYRMGLREEAAKEWSMAVRKLDDKQLLVASEIASRNEMYDRSINAADRTIVLHDFNLRYPAPYRESLQGRIQENNLEEAWVYGLMRQESRFVTEAKSNVGAAGLMQVMPATARWIAQKLGMKDYRKTLISQLDTNLKLGTYYMKSVLSSLGNNPVLASAAYNAGPARARQWQANKPLEGAIYIENIPFDETRDYVKKVMSNTVYYANLFGQSTPSLKQRLGIIDGGKTPPNHRTMKNER
ncbi:MAG TPA: transglycosylase SLT domain-containing protein [Gallionellaceae bacterium]|nr:transglycosylase SLT domain-containing protein [Gallionellaceae bacterium]